MEIFFREESLDWLLVA